MKRHNIYLPMTAMILTAALALPAAAQKQVPLEMTFSGSKVATTIDLGPNTRTDEVHLAGNSTLGPFTFRSLRADETIPQSFGRCGDGSGPNLRVVAGGGVFRFQDGSLLTATITGGALCLDLDHMVGHLNETYQITGGTRRFEGAKGSLALTATLRAVLYDASNQPVLLTMTGELDGTLCAAAIREEGQNEPQ
ncbi:MAG: hypothetical protein M3Y57_17780 [Acidobacteriota bacterium]|nr:hypothetical protein [Acidobacteriota bacterium]